MKYNRQQKEFINFRSAINHKDTENPQEERLRELKMGQVLKKKKLYLWFSLNHKYLPDP